MRKLLKTLFLKNFLKRSNGDYLKHIIDEDLKILIALTILNIFFLECIRLFPSYLYRGLWWILWENGPTYLLLGFLAFFSPVILNPFKRKVNEISLIARTIIFSILVILISLDLGLIYRTFILTLAVFVYPITLLPLLILSNSKERIILYPLSLSLAIAYDITFRAVGLAFEWRLDIISIPINFVLFLILLASLRGISVDQSVSNLSASYLSWLVLSLLLFVQLNIIGSVNTVLRIAFTNYKVFQFYLFSFITNVTILVSLFIILYYLEGVKEYISGSSLLMINFILLICIVNIFFYKGLVALLFSLLAEFIIILDLFLISADLIVRADNENLYLGFQVFYITYLIFAILYTFTFVYPYLPGIYFFGKRVLEIFSLAILLVTISILGKLFSKWEISILKIVINKKQLFALLIIPILVTPTAFFLHGEKEPVYEMKTSLRVMSYNIHQGFDINNRVSLYELYKTIKEANPDIVGLQEVDTGRITSAYIDNLLWLSNKLGMHAIFAPAIGSTYGVAILSKFPIRFHKEILLTSYGEQRAMLHAVIDTGYSQINFVTLHLGLDQYERVHQIVETLSYLEDIKGPIVMVGDFNAEQGSLEITIVNNFFYDARKRAKVVKGYEATWPSDEPVDRIDYIFVSGHWVVNYFETVNSTASDHLPVIADIELAKILTISGSFYANDAGEPKGGFEWAGQYNVTGEIFLDGTGWINITIVAGLGDPLDEHFYLIKEFKLTKDNASFYIKPFSGETWYRVVLNYTANDTIWNTYHGYYIGRYINPEIFPGLVAHYYVEIRLKFHYL